MKPQKTKSPGLAARRSSHKIQWLNLPGYKGETWNPIIGCSKISEGCKNCYAEKMALRLQHMPGGKQYHDVLNFEPIHEKKGWTGLTHLVESQLNKPLKWKTTRVIFVCSMGDLFHESTSFSAIDDIFSVMACNPQHIFIVLTKRAKRMAEYINDPLTRSNLSYNILKSKNSGYAIEDPLQEDAWPLKNLWLGVSTENQEQANKRLPFLLQVPAAVRFVSIEPMLGPVDISLWLCSGFMEPPFTDVINWVICGGESGHNARPMHPDWVRSLRDQCKHAGVPFFFKQWGELLPGCQRLKEHIEPTWNKEGLKFPSRHNSNKTNTYYKVGKHISGNLLDGVKYEEYPSFDYAQDDEQPVTSNQ